MIRKPSRKFFLIVLAVALLLPLTALAAPAPLVTDGTFDTTTNPLLLVPFTVGANNGV